MHLSNSDSHHFNSSNTFEVKMANDIRNHHNFVAKLCFLIFLTACNAFAHKEQLEMLI